LKIDTRNKRIFVTFIYWDNTWDAWISESDNVIAPLHSYTYVEGGKLQVGQRIEALDKTNKWLHAFVIDISNEKEQVKVHYRGWHEKFDEWLDKKGSRIRPYGRNKPIVQRRRREQKLWRVPGQLLSNTSDGGNNRFGPKSEQNILSDNEALKGGWGTDADSTQHKIARLPNNSHDDAEHRRQISEVSDRYNQYIEALQAQPVPLKVVSVPGDGNCLFRSVAHQVYGDYELHNLVRQRCMDYMEADAGFYSQFVEGGMEAFPFYLRAKRLNACWGDDPEIQVFFPSLESAICL
jgi:OTU-like cysteine protease